MKFLENVSGSFLIHSMFFLFSGVAIELFFESNRPRKFFIFISIIIFGLVDFFAQSIYKRMTNLMKELSVAAVTDILTGLPNRRALEEEIEKAMLRAKRNQTLLVFCIFDLDGFKEINDKYGHQSGDKILQYIGESIPKVIRKTDFLSRLGGDEFVLILDGIKQFEAIEYTLKKIEKVFSKEIQIDDEMYCEIGFSMGVSIYFPTEEKESGENFLRMADQALYESKSVKHGREDPWVFFGQKPKLKKTPLQNLLYNGGLKVMYQPIMDCKRKKIVGAESLSRMVDIQGKILQPSDFIEKLDIDDIGEITIIVLRKALELLMEIPDPNFWISVNLDPRCLNDKNVKSIIDIIDFSAISPRKIVLELLEGGDFVDTAKQKKQLEKLQEFGCLIALDDVGTAYSSLLRMRNLPIDKIKLDQSFIRSVKSHPEDLVFIQAMQELASGLGVSMVAEGVEDEDILEAIISLQVNCAQGYGIAKPMEKEQLMFFVKNYEKKDENKNASFLKIIAENMMYNKKVKILLSQDKNFMNFEINKNSTCCPIIDYIENLSGNEKIVEKIKKLHQEYHKLENDEIVSMKNGKDPEKIENLSKISREITDLIIMLQDSN